MTQVESEAAWILEDRELVELLDLAWTDETWREDNDEGLIKTLDENQDWSDWRGWDQAKIREELVILLNQRIDETFKAWIFADEELAARLTAVWGGDTWQDEGSGGLIATLDENSAWYEWREWDNSKKLATLAELLTEWEPQESTETPAAPTEIPAPVEDDVTKPRWNADDSIWEIYNLSTKQWWATDEPSGTWYDPVGKAWVPNLYWVTATQAETAAEIYGSDWPAHLVSALDKQWGTGWHTEHEPDHMTAWLGDLLPTLRVTTTDTATETPEVTVTAEEIELTLEKLFSEDGIVTDAELEAAGIEFEAMDEDLPIT